MAHVARVAVSTRQRQLRVQLPGISPGQLLPRAPRPSSSTRASSSWRPKVRGRPHAVMPCFCCGAGGGRVMPSARPGCWGGTQRFKGLSWWRGGQRDASTCVGRGGLPGRRSEDAPRPSFGGGHNLTTRNQSRAVPIPPTHSVVCRSSTYESEAEWGRGVSGTTNGACDTPSLHSQYLASLLSQRAPARRKVRRARRAHARLPSWCGQRRGSL